ncbi:phosphotransferase [Longispora albida]|uniref:phosphotransferase n=1 Tax=Longispora albida TaxID=203523 RepID=UPI00036A8B24|nr:phosphotransferase [Longispora albida]
MELLASGREAEVYALDEGRVLRRYLHRPAADGELAAMAWAWEAGYPVPRVHSVDGNDMVIDRLHGPTLAEALLAGELSPAEGGALLAGLHNRLHALPGFVLHLDLHPENVIMSGTGPVVIDWATAEPGDPRLDTAMTSLILAEVATSGQPWAGPAATLLAVYRAGVPDDASHRAEALARRLGDFPEAEEARIRRAAASL